MKRDCFLTTVVIFMLFLVFTAGSGYPQGPAAFSVERFVIAGSIENREPVGIVNAFSSYTEKVYCFLEARDIQEDTTVAFVWFHEGNEAARVTLPLRKGQKWRTYSSKILGSRTGAWTVELRDPLGTVLQEASFTVE